MGFIHDRLVTAGHSVEYFCADDVDAAFRGRLSRFAFPWLVRRRAIAAARVGRPYDLINVHEPSAAAISILKRSAGNPAVVVTSHGLERRAWEVTLEEARLGRDGPSLKTRLTYPLMSLPQSRFGLRHADHVFCLNDEDRNYLINELELSGRHVTRIYPGAATVFATASQQRDYARTQQLLFAGSWLQRKGIEDLVKAFFILARRYPKLCLTVLGAGVPEKVVRSSFPESLQSRVRWVHAKNDGEAALEFAAADIFLLPSLFEGTPLTLLEAMMSGLPILTTATCGMKDVIRDGENGMLVPIRSPQSIVSAVEQLLSSISLRAKLGRAAQIEALDRYVWDRVATPVQAVYEELCETNHGAAARANT